MQFYHSDKSNIYKRENVKLGCFVSEERFTLSFIKRSSFLSCKDEEAIWTKVWLSNIWSKNREAEGERGRGRKGSGVLKTLRMRGKENVRINLKNQLETDLMFPEGKLILFNTFNSFEKSLEKETGQN